MHTWRITFRPEPGVRRLVADVDAEELATDLDGARLTLWRYVLIVDSPRRIAVLRVGRSEAVVEPLCSAQQQDDQQHGAAGRCDSGVPCTHSS